MLVLVYFSFVTPMHASFSLFQFCRTQKAVSFQVATPELRRHFLPEGRISASLTSGEEAKKRG